jgi:hypothetical protein
MAVLKLVGLRVLAPKLRTPTWHLRCQRKAIESRLLSAICFEAVLNGAKREQIEVTDIGIGSDATRRASLTITSEGAAKNDQEGPGHLRTTTAAPEYSATSARRSASASKRACWVGVNCRRALGCLAIMTRHSIAALITSCPVIVGPPALRGFWRTQNVLLRMVFESITVFSTSAWQLTGRAAGDW